jgi:hypothetical protein
MVPLLQCEENELPRMTFKFDALVFRSEDQVSEAYFKKFHKAQQELNSANCTLLHYVAQDTIKQNYLKAAGHFQKCLKHAKSDRDRLRLYYLLI